MGSVVDFIMHAGKILVHWYAMLSMNFFLRGIYLSFFGQTKLVLLPKINNPEKAKDFRAISCCNTVYKCITKLIYSRLKEVLPHIIDKGQRAFVKERELLFNVLLCQDLVRGYNRKLTPPQLFNEGGLA